MQHFDATLYDAVQYKNVALHKFKKITRKNTLLIIYNIGLDIRASYKHLMFDTRTTFAG